MDIAKLNKHFENKSPEEVLTYFLHEFGDKIALSSSLSIEDQALTDMIVKIKKDTKIFTLDTGRLFPETYSLIDRTNLKYGIKHNQHCVPQEVPRRAHIFSVAVKPGIRENSWCTMPMPASSASKGFAKSTFSPLSSTSPP